MPLDTSSDVPVLAPTGALDLVNARSLASELSELAGVHGNAILDLTEVEFIDSIGLGVVLKGATRFHRQDKQLVLVVPPEGRVARLLELSGLGQRLAVADTRDAAVTLATGAR